MIWRLNDPWPILYWSVVDAYGEPKIPYYFLRRAYLPLLISFEQTADTIAVWVTNDGPVPVTGHLTVRRARFTGEIRSELSTGINVTPGASRRLLDLTPFGPINLRSEFLWAELRTPSATYRASHLLIAERYLHLPKATLEVHRVDGGVEVSTDHFARQVTLEWDLARPGVRGAVFADNYFDLVPGSRRAIAILGEVGSGTPAVRALNAAGVRLPR
jgi:beta-mannosidase